MNAMRTRPYIAKTSFTIASTMLLVLVCQATALAATVERSWSVITLRTYGTDDEWGPNLHQARIQVESIFREAGISIVWLNCLAPAGTLDDSAAACRSPLKSNELVVRIMAAHDDTGKQRVLGEALVDPRSDAPCLSTIYVDRVMALSRTAGVSPGIVLGRAIAHEIGHLLLGTSLHSEEGLMRALWSRRQLQRNRPRDWNFLREESDAIRAAATKRETGSTPHAALGAR